MAVTFEFGNKSENIQEYMEIRESLKEYLLDNYDYGKVTATLTYDSSFKGEYQEKRRISVQNDGNIFVYAKGRRRWGNYLTMGSHLLSVTVPEKRKSDEEIWRDSWQKVVDYLEQSGLWTNNLAEYKLGLEIGYEKIKEADRAYWKDYDTKTERVKAIDERLINTNEEGVEYVNTRIVWHMAQPAKVKTIYFGKYGETERVRDELKEALENKEKYIESRQVPNYYDVMVEYNPEYNRAWYNEEYRNCGNGHYYILLDHEHALFVEDD